MGHICPMIIYLIKGYEYNYKYITMENDFSHPCNCLAGKCCCCCSDDFMNYNSAGGRFAWEYICYPIQCIPRTIISLGYVLSGCCFLHCCFTKSMDYINYHKYKYLYYTTLCCVPCCIAKNRFRVMEECIGSEEAMTKHLRGI